MSGGYELKTSTDSITDDDNMKINGPFSITLAEKDSVAPALTIGLSSTGPRFGGFIDFGARFNQVAVSVDYGDEVRERLNDEQRKGVDDYIKDANKELGRLADLIPIVQFGLRYNF